MYFPLPPLWATSKPSIASVISCSTPETAESIAVETAPPVTGLELPLVTAESIVPSVAEIFPSVSEIAEMYFPLPPLWATSKAFTASAIFPSRSSVTVCFASLRARVTALHEIGSLSTSESEEAM